MQLENKDRFVQGHLTYLQPRPPGKEIERIHIEKYVHFRARPQGLKIQDLVFGPAGKPTQIKTYRDNERTAFRGAKISGIRLPPDDFDFFRFP
jgi:hypothetical protein